MEDNIFPVKTIEESIWSSDIRDLTIDYSEIALDDLAKCILGEHLSPTLESMPVVKMGVAALKLGAGIKTLFDLKKQLTFIQSVQNGHPDEDQVKKRKEAALKGEKWLYREIELTALYLERYSDAKKAKIQAALYVELINGNLSFVKYQDFLTVLDQLILNDIGQLIEISYEENMRSVYPKLNTSPSMMARIEIHYVTRCNRLYSLGLLQHDEKNNKYALSPEGKYFSTLLSKLGYSDEYRKLRNGELI